MDLLLEMSKNPAARNVIRGLGLPLPQPPVLKRSKAAWGQRILNDETVVVFGAAPSPSLAAVAQTLAPLGARVVWSGGDEAAKSFESPAEAWAEPLTHSAGPREGDRIYGLVIDATGFQSVAELDQLYKAVAPWLKSLSRGGRIVLVGSTLTDIDARQGLDGAEHVAAQAALDGFSRSLAKELGRKGTTVNLLRVSKGAESRLPSALRFFLSRYSAFVTGQPLTISNQVRVNTPQPWERPLHGRRALVTGAARGIGKATARALAREGAHVIIVDRLEAEADASRLADEIDGSLALLDITSDDAVSQLAAKFSQVGNANIVVHNAGITRDKTLGRMSQEQWQSVLDVNLRAVASTTRQLLERGLVEDEGRIVLLASVTGIAGNPGQTNYAASKAGLIGYARALAKELAPRGTTVNAVAPGLIETRMTQAMPLMVREAARRLSALNQGGLPDDVAEAILFLALPHSDGISGEVLRVCGGALVGA